jgi:ribose transport system substrate-binding protein
LGRILRGLAGTALAVALLLVAASAGAQSPTAPGSPAPSIVPGGPYDTSRVAGCARGVTKGPNGETGVPGSQLSVTPDEAATLQAGTFKAAILWHTSGAWVNAVGSGIKDALGRYGIEVVSETDAALDPATQASQVQGAMALDPDVVIALVIDPVSGAQAFKAVTAAGKKLVLISNLPSGYRPGTDYVSIVSDDFFAMGRAAADLMGKALDGTGKIGYLFHDASYYMTNQRDQAFRTVIRQCFPGIQIVAQEGITDPTKARDVAAAMLAEHPELTGIYVTWDQPAEGVVAALKDARRTDVKVVTLDLGAANDLEMAQGGLISGKAIELTYDLGTAVADASAYALLGKQAPPFVMAPAMEVTRDDLAQAYQAAWRVDPPDEVMKALGK